MAEVETGERLATCALTYPAEAAAREKVAHSSLDDRPGRSC
jgi:hypothetical protein